MSFSFRFPRFSYGFSWLFALKTLTFSWNSCLFTALVDTKLPLHRCKYPPNVPFYSCFSTLNCSNSVIPDEPLETSILNHLLPFRPHKRWSMLVSFCFTMKYESYTKKCTKNSLSFLPPTWKWLFWAVLSEKVPKNSKILTFI